MDNSTGSMDAMVIGGDLIRELGIEIKLFKHTIVGGGGIYEG